MEMSEGLSDECGGNIFCYAKYDFGDHNVGIGVKWRVTPE